MGDFRFSFKAEFQMGDVKDSCDMWLNYSPRDGVIDHRVMEWLENLFQKGYEEIQSSMIEYELNYEHETVEKEERKEYERLKAKYEEQP